MELTPSAQQSLDFSMACFLQGMCTAKEYLNAVKSIYCDDVEKQIAFLQDHGLTRKQAQRQIYHVQKEEIL